MCVGGGGVWVCGKQPLQQTPLKQKQPFSGKNKLPSQDDHQWGTSAGRGSSIEGQDVLLRTLLRRDAGQKYVYIDPSLSLLLSPSSFALLFWPSRKEGREKERKKEQTLPCLLCPLHPLLPRHLQSCSQRGGERGRGAVLSKQRPRGKDSL